MLTNLTASLVNGCVLTPLHPMGSLADHAYVIGDAEIECLVFDADHFADRAREIKVRYPDLILLDLNLPDMTGLDILEKVKANPHTRRSPVVVLTTTDDSQEIQRCYDLGANVYITKPVNYDGFANAIRQLGLFFSVMEVPANP